MIEGAPDWAGVAGLVISSVLALVTIYDRFIKKTNPVTTYAMRSLAELGNDILIANPNPTPILMLHWELYWGVHTWRGMVPNELQAMPEDGYDLVTIEPFGWHKLHFVDDEHFNALGRRDAKVLFIDLYIVGRRGKLRLRIYPDRKTLRDHWRELRRRLAALLRRQTELRRPTP